MSARQILLNVLGNKCNSCGSTENLEIHHKDKNPKNSDIRNIELVCHNCHLKKHGKSIDGPTTIHASEGTHKELRKIKGELMASNGKERSFDDVILELIKHWKEKKE